MIDDNLASCLEVVARQLPDAVAVRQGQAQLTFAELDSAASSLAGFFTSAGVKRNDNVGILLRNSPEYVVSLYAAMKCRASGVNINFRYRRREIAYLLNDCRAVGLVFHTSLAEEVEGLQAECPTLRFLIAVDDDGQAVGEWATPFERCQEHPAQPPVQRSGDDLYILYTGGTTGFPKGVMWSHRSIVDMAARTLLAKGLPKPESVQDFARLAQRARDMGTHEIRYIAPPLMHGTGSNSAFQGLVTGDTIVLSDQSGFDADAVWRAVGESGASKLSIAGDAFGRPLLAALEAAERDNRPYDLSQLRMITNSGAVLSAAVKKGILARADVTIWDGLGSSESPGLGSSRSSRESGTDTAQFTIGKFTKVFTEDWSEVEPGSGVVGRLGVGGPHLPLGYLNDPAKTEATFRVIAGVRYSIAGDLARVEADGVLTLLGRESSCINTGGEKVYAEEVEEVLKEHPAVVDALVVGIADDRWGQKVTAVVSVTAPVTEPDLQDAVRGKLAGYKVPREIVVVEEVRRSAAGKPDYAWARSVLQSRGEEGRRNDVGDSRVSR